MNEEMVLISQDVKEVGQIMSTYVGIVRSDLRLKRAWNRLDLLYEETEELFKRSVVSRELCELRNIINTGAEIGDCQNRQKHHHGEENYNAPDTPPALAFGPDFCDQDDQKEQQGDTGQGIEQQQRPAGIGKPCGRENRSHNFLQMRTPP